MDNSQLMFIVANPTSGRGRGKRTAESVARILSQAGRQIHVRYTSARGDAERIAREACSGIAVPDCVIACGGDGTIQEVVNGIMTAAVMPSNEKPVLGLAPAGRCNDFARAFDITRSHTNIANILLHGHARPVDLGRVNGRYFCTVATVGIDASVTDYVDRMRLPLKGTLAYVYAAIRVLMSYRAPRLNLAGDFGEFEQEVFLASSANTSSYGGAIPIAPDALPDDGLLDICIIDRISRLRALAMIPIIMASRHESRKCVKIVRTRQLHIDSQESLEIWADGERVAKTPATLEAVPAAIRIIQPIESLSQTLLPSNRRLANADFPR